MRVFKPLTSYVNAEDVYNKVKVDLCRKKIERIKKDQIELIEQQRGKNKNLPKKKRQNYPTRFINRSDKMKKKSISPQKDPLDDLYEQLNQPENYQENEEIYYPGHSLDFYIDHENMKGFFDEGKPVKLPPHIKKSLQNKVITNITDYKRKIKIIREEDQKRYLKKFGNIENMIRSRKDQNKHKLVFLKEFTDETQRLINSKRKEWKLSIYMIKSRKNKRKGFSIPVNLAKVTQSHNNSQMNTKRLSRRRLFMNKSVVKMKEPTTLNRENQEMKITNIDNEEKLNIFRNYYKKNNRKNNRGMSKVVKGIIRNCKKQLNNLKDVKIPKAKKDKPDMGILRSLLKKDYNEKIEKMAKEVKNPAREINKFRKIQPKNKSIVAQLIQIDELYQDGNITKLKKHFHD